MPLAGEITGLGLEESRGGGDGRRRVVSIGDRIGEELQRGTVQYILLEGTQGYSILTLCGKEALFLVLASVEVKQGILMLEIRRVVEEMAQLIG